MFNVRIKSYRSYTVVNYYTSVQTSDEYRLRLKKKHTSEMLQNKYLRDSLKRSKGALYDIAACNEWKYFITLTFKDEYIRMNYENVRKNVRQFFNNLKKRQCPDVTYLLVMERHKKGGYHLHGLLNGVYNQYMSPAINKNTGKNIFIGGKQIFNWNLWKLGFSTVSEIQNLDKTISYITKYISKDIIFEKGKSRYICSRGLKKPEVVRLYDDEFSKSRKLNISDTDLVSTYCSPYTHGEVFSVRRKKEIQ